MKVEATLARLRSLVTQMEVDAGDTRLSGREQYGSRMIYISPASQPDFNDLFLKFSEEPGWADRFSLRTLKDELLGAIDATYHHQEEAYLTAMIERLDSARPRHRVLVPLSGVVLGAGVAFDFGGVSLVQMTPELFAEELSRRFPDELHVRSENQAISYSFDVSRDFDPNGLYATFSADVDARKAAELIDSYIAPVADYLQYCLAAMGTPQRYDCPVDYKGRYNRLNSNAAIVIDENSSQAALTVMDSKVSVRMSIAADSANFLNHRGIQELSTLFAPGALEASDEYSKLIYRAIRVFAEGERSHSPRQRILSYVTACELFFSQPIDTTRAVTEGVAYVLGADYNTRTRIMAAMKTMYAARSATTHEGLEPDNLARYRGQVLEVLSHLIWVRKVSPDLHHSKQDLTDWINRQRFSGEPVP